MLVESGITPFFLSRSDTFRCNGFGLNIKEPGPFQPRATAQGSYAFDQKICHPTSHAGPVSEDLRELVDY